MGKKQGLISRLVLITLALGAFPLAAHTNTPDEQDLRAQQTEQLRDQAFQCDIAQITAASQRMADQVLRVSRGTIHGAKGLTKEERKDFSTQLVEQEKRNVANKKQVPPITNFFRKQCKAFGMDGFGAPCSSDAECAGQVDSTGSPFEVCNALRGQCGHRQPAQVWCERDGECQQNICNKGSKPVEFSLVDFGRCSAKGKVHAVCARDSDCAKGLVCNSFFKNPKSSQIFAGRCSPFKR